MQLIEILLYFTDWCLITVFLFHTNHSSNCCWSTDLIGSCGCHSGNFVLWWKALGCWSVAYKKTLLVHSRVNHNPAQTTIRALDVILDEKGEINELISIKIKNFQTLNIHNQFTVRMFDRLTQQQTICLKENNFTDEKCTHFWES